jgi:hypothetical protein
LAVVLALLTVDYTHARQRYEWIASWTRPVDEVLRADPDDVAVLEWPLNRSAVDVDAMLRSVWHGKRVVNGFAGFVIEAQRELSGVLATSVPPFASPAARRGLTEIYPLRYVIVRDSSWPQVGWPAGPALAAASDGFLRFRGSHGPDDLYEIVPLPDRGHLLRRLVAYDLLRSRPVLRLGVRPLRAEDGVEQAVKVVLNGAPVTTAPLGASTTVSVLLAPPFRRSAPNVIGLEHDYRRGPAARGPAHRIGTTGTTSPVDVLVRSGGQPYGDVASIRIGIREVAPNRRGYNLVALGPEGDLRGHMAFDTLGDASASGRLAAWVHGLPAETIVLGAVKDEASGQLGPEAVQALARLGVAGDLRGRYRESHAFVGVKGALPGSAIEGLGPRLVELRVGDPDAGFGFELTEFALEPAAFAR